MEGGRGNSIRRISYSAHAQIHFRYVKRAPKQTRSVFILWYTKGELWTEPYTFISTPTDIISSI